MLTGVRLVKKTLTHPLAAVPNPGSPPAAMVNGAGARIGSPRFQIGSIEPEATALSCQPEAEKTTMIILDPKTGQTVIIDTKPRR